MRTMQVFHQLFRCEPLITFMYSLPYYQYHVKLTKHIIICPLLVYQANQILRTQSIIYPAALIFLVNLTLCSSSLLAFLEEFSLTASSACFLFYLAVFLYDLYALFLAVLRLIQKCFDLKGCHSL